MDIASLKTVLLVQTHGSFAGAARALDLDPSSVSRLVASVETELGIRLFQRTTRNLTLTEAGHIYLQRAAPLIEELDAAQEEALVLRARPTGLLRMTASVAFSTQVIVPLLDKFQGRYSDIAVDLQSSDNNLDLVENGIDLAIRLAPSLKGNLVSTRLMQTSYMVVASPQFLDEYGAPRDPQSIGEFDCLRFALPGIQNVWRFQKAQQEPFDVPVQGNLLISNALALREAACSGMGLALLADWLVQQDLKDGRLVEVFPEYRCTLSNFETAAWALYPSRSYLPRKVRVMIDFLRTNLDSPEQ